MIRLRQAALKAALLLPLVALGCAMPGAAPLSGAHARVAITVAPSTYQLAGIVHRWEADDVHTFDVTLYEAYATELIKVGETLEVPAASPVANFTNLSTDKPYKVGVLARGNQGGTAAEIVLNENTPSLTPIQWLFFESVDGVVKATIDATVALDPVEADPGFSIEIGMPEEGRFAEPTATETVKVK